MRCRSPTEMLTAVPREFSHKTQKTLIHTCRPCFAPVGAINDKHEDRAHGKYSGRVQQTKRLVETPNDELASLKKHKRKKQQKQNKNKRKETQGEMWEGKELKLPPP